MIDERFDTELLDAVARMRPDWSFVMVGPVVKISEDELPKRAPTSATSGPKTYDRLPAYLSGWDVALMPFAMNKSTRFISPTKTPEYLAGGKPVVSTPVKDVVRHYGQLEGVQASPRPPRNSSRLAKRALELSRNPESGWLAEADLMLSAKQLGHGPGADGRPWSANCSAREREAVLPRCSWQRNDRAPRRPEG